MEKAGWDNLDFYRRVDALVALHVMKWSDISIVNIDNDKWMCRGVDHNKWPGYVPLYSKMIANAWDVVRVFPYINLTRDMDFVTGSKWKCKLRDDKGVLSEKDEYINKKYWAWAETAELAICYAGLKAMEFDLKSFLKEEGK